MAKKKNNPVTPLGGAPARNTAPAQKAQGGSKSVTDVNTDFFKKKSTQLLVLLGIAFVTFFSYYACLDNQFTNWDDLGYIISDPYIKNNTLAGYQKIFDFSTNVMGNYHPLTILIYAIEYSYKELQPFIYHFDSIIAHVLTTLAVYFFVKKLTGRPVAAMVAALLFGVHPMHVESVAWAAGRKDILYSLFYVMACTAYVNYVRTDKGGKIKWYASILVLFTLSLLCKSVAVTFPVVLFAIDYFERRKIDIWLFIEKIPYFALSLAFGLGSVRAQKVVGAYGSLDAHFNSIERFSLGCYALCTYLWKAVVPVGLTNFYPYPLKLSDALPVNFYAYPVIVLALIFLIWKFARHNRLVIFGLGFFIINIVLLLQFIPVGGAIVSDRYGYLPYLGFFLIAGWYVSNYFEDKAKVQTGKTILGIVVAYSLVLGFMSNERCKDWYDSATLWRDNIQKYPDAPVGYFYLGQEYFTRYEIEGNPNEKKNLGDSSLKYFNLSVLHKPDYINPIICIAELQRNYGETDAAIATYRKAMAINSKNESVYLGLGVAYSIKQQFDTAAYFFRTALSLKPFFPEAYSNYANYLDIVGKLDSSLLVYATAISQNPDAYIPYMNRARIYIRKGMYDDALKDCNRGIEVKPEVGDLYILRARCYAQKGNKAQAMQDIQKGQSLGAKVDATLAQLLK